MRRERFLGFIFPFLFFTAVALGEEETYWNAPLSSSEDFTDSAYWTNGAPDGTQAAHVSNGGIACIHDGDEIELGAMAFYLELGSTVLMDGGSVSSEGNVFFGNSPSSEPCRLTMSGGTWLTSGEEFVLGWCPDDVWGSLLFVATLSGGTSVSDRTVIGSTGAYLIVGDSGVTGTISMDGYAQLYGATSGAVIVGNAASGDSDGGVGSIVMNGFSDLYSKTELDIGLGGGTGTIVMNDNATLVSDGAAYLGSGGTGSLTVNGNASASFLSLKIGSDSAGAGTFEMTGGTVTVAEGISLSSDGGKGSMTLSGSSSLTLEGGNFIVGENSSQEGSLTMSGDAVIYANAAIRIGYSGSTTGNVTMSGNSQIQQTSGNLILGDSSGVTAYGATGVLLLKESAAIFKTGGDVYVGNSNVSNTGRLTMSDDSRLLVGGSGNDFVVSHLGGKGIVALSGNAVLSTDVESYGMEQGGNIVIAENGTGSVTMSGNAMLSSGSGYLYIGGGPNSFSSYGTPKGTLTVNGGTVNAANAIVLGSGLSTSIGTLVLNGGLVSAGSIRKGTGAGSLIFNGGVIKAAADSVDYFSGFDSSDFDIRDGGLVFDTGGHDVTIIQALEGAGGLTKAGDGTLTLNSVNAYSGNTEVRGGMLTLDSICLSDASTVTIGADGVLNLNFTGTDAIGRLVVDGVTYTSGLYGAGDFGGFLIGAGTLTVVPEPAAAGMVIVGGLVFSAFLRGRRARRIGAFRRSKVFFSDTYCDLDS